MSQYMRRHRLSAFIDPENKVIQKPKELPKVRNPTKINLGEKPRYTEIVDIESIIMKKTDGISALSIDQMKKIAKLIFKTGDRNFVNKGELVAYLTTPERLALIEWNNKLVREQANRARILSGKKYSGSSTSSSGISSEERKEDSSEEEISDKKRRRKKREIRSSDESGISTEEDTENRDEGGSDTGNESLVESSDENTEENNSTDTSEEGNNTESESFVDSSDD